MKKILSIVMMLCLLIGAMGIEVFAQIPSKDVRAVWISTIYNLDYPSMKNDEEAQKKEFIEKLDELKSIGINTIVMQVRPKADALYASRINPWSEVLTGVQGKDPGYDPMAFMIEETHKRGMSFHAWLNPYRVTTSGIDIQALSKNHPARINPSWTLTHNNALYYNPALPEVKKHIVDTVKELVTQYEVDGIHFDDYFYPSNYPLPEGEGRDGGVANSRRAHINDMIRQVSETIRNINPKVSFGISPTGIWKNELSDITGSNTGGSESYYTVAADTRTWIQNGWIDYVVPQIYWEVGHSLADYETLVKWWSNEVSGTNVKLYIGQGIYKDVVAKEIDKQLALNQNYSAVEGSFYFSLKDLLNNRMGAKDRIKAFYAGNNNIWPETPDFSKPTLSDGVKEETGISGTAAIGKNGVVLAAQLNVRNGARIDREVITKLSKGEKVTILDVLSDWYKVRLKTNEVGWVNSEYIKVTTQNANQQTSSNQTTRQSGKVNTEGLNVRSGPGTTYKALTKLKLGTNVQILKTQNSWHQIKWEDGQSGWVSKNYITLY